MIVGILETTRRRMTGIYKQLFVQSARRCKSRDHYRMTPTFIHVKS